MPEIIRFKNPKTFSKLLSMVRSYEPENFKNETDYNELMDMVNNHHLIGTVKPVKNGFVLDTIKFLRINKMRSVEVTGLFTVKEVIRYKGNMRITFEEIEYIFEVSVENYLILWHEAMQLYFEEFED